MNQVQMDLKDEMVFLAGMAPTVRRVSRGTLVYLDQEDLPETRDHLESPVCKDPMELRGPPDPMVTLESLGVLEGLEHG